MDVVKYTTAAHCCMVVHSPDPTPCGPDLFNVQGKPEWLLDVLWMRTQLVRRWSREVKTRQPPQLRHFAAVTSCFTAISRDTNLGAAPAGSMIHVMVHCAWCAAVLTSMLHVQGAASGCRTRACSGQRSFFATPTAWFACDAFGLSAALRPTSAQVCACVQALSSTAVLHAGAWHTTLRSLGGSSRRAPCGRGPSQQWGVSTDQPGAYSDRRFTQAGRTLWRFEGRTVRPAL